MVRWALTSVEGQLGSWPAADLLAPGLTASPLEPDEQGQCLIEPRADESNQSRLLRRVRPLLDADKPNWVVLPEGERAERDWWRAQLADVAEPGFGRGTVALALGQLNRLATPGRVIAAYAPEPGEEGVEGALALEWAPSDKGMTFELARMDGRLDGKTDVGKLLNLGRETLAHPEALVCPGTGGDNNLERLLPFLGELGGWAGAQVRWEFPEAPLGQLGVAGSLYNWAWLEAGYRLRDWTGPCAVLEMDESHLVGLSAVSWHG
ncbi:hypothetical protein ACMDCT_09445 [Halomonadaceae bacterium KBTZ08]